MVLLLIMAVSADSLYLSYLHFSRGYRYEVEGRFSEALDLYQKAKVCAQDGDEIDFYIARIRFLSGDYNGAKKIVNRLLKKREEFDYYQLLGDCEVKSSNINGAIAYYKKALSVRYDEFLAFHLATILETIGRLKEALEYYDELASSGEDPELAVKVASILGRLGRPRDVIDYLLAADLRGNSDYFLNLGIAYDQLAIKDSALIYYRKVLELDPTSTTVLKRLIDLYIQVDSLDQAQAVGEEALKLAPHDPALHRSIGYLDYKRGELEKALLHFIIAAGMVETDLYSHYYIGRIFFEKRDYEKAEDYLNRALKIDPAFPDARLYLGLISMDRHDYGDARRHFKKAMANGFDRAEGIYLVGLSRAMEGDLAGAYLDFKEALKLSPDDPKILAGLGDVCDDLGRQDEALSCYSRVIEIDSTSAIALNYVGYSYAERGDSLEYALRLVEKALDIDSTNGYYIDSLGWIYFKMGDYSRALEELSKASKLIEDVVILGHLGDVYLKLDKVDKAKEAYERAFELDPKNKELKEKLKDIKARY